MPNRVENFINIADETKKIFKFFHEIGLSRFELSEKSKAILNSWGKIEPIEKFYKDISECMRCNFCKSRNQIVAGWGNPYAKLMIIKDMPTYEEDKNGDPFEGYSGELLSNIIKATKIRKESIYIANLIKCTPPENTKPSSYEIDACLPFLQRQIKAISPKFICVFGSLSAQTILDSKMSIARLRGNFHDYKGIKLIATYSPSYLLEYPEKKKDVWEDMKNLMKEYKE
ncbi:MAG: uracil-DNA glycosylase [Desulfobacterales bacterium]|nr:uracil-DNA glycosylase [Desulfobacterales bacterium]MBF0395983.1 uracil-DNA glycosylase [Desulfobacterales bacterium]